MLIEKEEHMSDLEGGWVVGSQTIGEGYSKAPETPAMKHSKAMTRAAYGVETDREAENAIKRREKPFAGVDAFKSSKEFNHPSYMKRKGTDIPLGATATPEDLKYSGTKMIKRIIALNHGAGLSPEDNQRVKAAYPNGMTDDDIKSWLKDQNTKPQLRAVG